MSSQTTDLSEVLGALSALREEVDRLNQRVAALETFEHHSSPAARDADISDEVLIAISAAIAAFLGEKPKIRQARLVGTASWAQHGRATIQATRNHAIQRG